MDVKLWAAVSAAAPRFLVAGPCYSPLHGLIFGAWR